MKYIKKVSLLTLVLIFITISHTFATSGVINTDGVRVRKETSTDSGIVTILNKTAEVEIVEETDEWYKIKYTWNGNYEGYVKKQFVNVNGSNAPVVSSPEPTPEVKDSPTPQVTQTPESTIEPTQEPPETIPVASDITKTIALGENKVNQDAKIYILPTISSSIKDTIKSGILVNIQEIAGKFAYIKYDNKYGWIRLIDLQQLEQKNDDNPNFAEKKGYVNVNSAIVRAKATTNSAVVASYGYNAEVKIIGEEGDFYKILVNGKECYIAKRLISDTKNTTNRSSSELRQVEPIVQDNKEDIDINTEEIPNVEIQKSNVPKSPIGEQIAQKAKGYIGHKYVYGGASPSIGFDCSGLIYYICNELGYNVSRTADYQVNNGVPVEKASLQPGDLVFFSNYKTYTGIGHVGIYIGDNQFVHASSENTGVKISSLNEDMYIKRYVTARRIGV